MSPATWENKNAENEEQIGEATENFSILLHSFGETNRNLLLIALLTENVVETYSSTTSKFWIMTLSVVRSH